MKASYKSSMGAVEGYVLMSILASQIQHLVNIYWTRSSELKFLHKLRGLRKSVFFFLSLPGMS